MTDQGAPTARLLAQLLEIAATADCPNCEIPFGSHDGGCDECQAARAAVEEGQKVHHDHGSAPWSAECAECQRESWVFERERAERREKELQREIDVLQDAWFQDEGIAPDGNLRAMVSRTVARANQLQALVARIHRLSDPNDEPQASAAQRPSESLPEIERLEAGNASLRAEGEKDYADMRRFQSLYINADHARIAAENERDKWRVAAEKGAGAYWNELRGQLAAAKAENASLRSVLESQHKEWLEEAGRLIQDKEAAEAENASLLESLREAEKDVAEVQAAREWIFNKTGVGGGTRPLSFITASHEQMQRERAAAEQRAEAAEQALRRIATSAEGCDETIHLQPAWVLGVCGAALAVDAALAGPETIAEGPLQRDSETLPETIPAARAALHDEERSAPGRAEPPAGPSGFCCDIRAVYGHGVHRTGCPGAQGEEK